MPFFLKNTLTVLLPKEKRHFFLLILSDILVYCLDILLMVLLLALVDAYIHSGKMTFSFFNHIFSGNSLKDAVIVLFLFILKNTLANYIAAAQHKFAYAVSARLSEQKALQYAQGPFSNYINTDASVFIKQISQHTIEFAHYVLSGWQQVISQGALLLVTALVTAVYNPLLFLLLVVLLLPPSVFVAFYTKRKIKTVRSNIKTAGEISLQFLKETLAGYTEGRLYQREHFFVQRYAEKQKVLNGFLSQLLTIQSVPSRLMEIFVVAGFVLLIAATKISSNITIQFFTIGAFLGAAYKIIPGAVKIINSVALINTYSYTVKELLNRTKSFATGSIKKNIQHIEFKNTCFGYNHTLLNDFNCSLSPGDFACVSTASGSGKTTLLNILLGFEEIQKGSIFFNSHLTNAQERQSYWGDIAYVKQQPFVLYDTIEKNITLDDGPANETLLNNVLFVTGIAEWLAECKEGLQTIITENGKNISGGQRQRIAIARALYKNANVIILDEPFSELDEISEIRLLQYFKSLAQEGKLILLVTHNKNSLRFCNKIIWADA